MSEPALLTFAEVWQTLRAVDVGKHTKQDPKGLTYLSWASAWVILMENYPDADVTYEPPLGAPLPDGTVMISCTVRIPRNDAEAFSHDRSPWLSRTMFLPVMTGFKNAAVQNPDARDVNDAMQRCFVKCCSRFGLAINLYTGEGLPGTEKEPRKRNRDVATSAGAAPARKSRAKKENPKDPSPAAELIAACMVIMKADGLDAAQGKIVLQGIYDDLLGPRVGDAFHSTHEIIAEKLGGDVLARVRQLHEPPPPGDAQAAEEFN